MNLKKEFNRLSDYFSGSMNHMQTTTEDLGSKMRDRASYYGERTRDGLRSSKDSLMSMEDMMMRHVRENPLLYILTGLLLVGAIIAKMTLYTEHRPMRPEW